AFRGAPPGTPLRRVAADASLFASMWGRPGGRRTICAYLPLFPRAPRLLHAAFGRLSGRAQARCSSHVRTVDSSPPRRRGGLHRKRCKRGRHAWRRASDHPPCTCCRSVSSPSPLNHQLRTTTPSGDAVALNSVRSHVVVLSCKAQAIRSARTVASTLVRCLLRIWLSRSSCCIFLNTNSTCQRAR